MTELAFHLRAMRADLVNRMGAELAADGAWQVWLPLLATVETAIQAVEAVIEERGGPPRTQENASCHATKIAPERP